jgi:hypothetical protein
MTWYYYRLVFLSVAAWCIWSLFTRDTYYAVFARRSPETRVPTWQGRLAAALGAILMIWLAFQR